MPDFHHERHQSVNPALCFMGNALRKCGNLLQTLRWLYGVECGEWLVSYSTRVGLAGSAWRLVNVVGVRLSPTGSSSCLEALRRRQ